MLEAGPLEDFKQEKRMLESIIQGDVEFYSVDSFEIAGNVENLKAKEKGIPVLNYLKKRFFFKKSESLLKVSLKKSDGDLFMIPDEKDKDPFDLQAQEWTLEEVLICSGNKHSLILNTAYNKKNNAVIVTHIYHVKIHEFNKKVYEEVETYLCHLCEVSPRLKSLLVKAIVRKVK